jgi:hypothetical protein
VCIEQMRAQGRPVSLWRTDEAPVPSRKRALSFSSSGSDCSSDDDDEQRPCKAVAPGRIGTPLSPLLIHTAANNMVARFGLLRQERLVSATTAAAVL